MFAFRRPAYLLDPPDNEDPRQAAKHQHCCSDCQRSRKAAGPIHYESRESRCDHAGKVCETILQAGPSSSRVRTGEGLWECENTRTGHSATYTSGHKPRQIYLRARRETSQHQTTNDHAEYDHSITSHKQHRTPPCHAASIFSPKVVTSD